MAEGGEKPLQAPRALNNIGTNPSGFVPQPNRGSNDMAKRKTVRPGKSLAPRVPAGFKERGGDLPNSWMPAIGDSLTGKLLGFKTVHFPKKGKEAAKDRDVAHVVDESTGEVLGVWISAGLKGRITPKDVNHLVSITRGPDVKIKGQPSPMKSYRVFVK